MFWEVVDMEELWSMWETRNRKAIERRSGVRMGLEVREGRLVLEDWDEFMEKLRAWDFEPFVCSSGWTWKGGQKMLEDTGPGSEEQFI